MLKLRVSGFDVCPINSRLEFLRELGGVKKILIAVNAEKLSNRNYGISVMSRSHIAYPDGIGAEVFSFDLLHKAWLKNLGQKYREHVHLNFFDYESQLAFDETTCPVKTISCPELFRRPDIILDINTLSQYEFAKKLYEYLYPKNKTFAIQDILQWHDTVYAELQK